MNKYNKKKDKLQRNKVQLLLHALFVNIYIAFSITYYCITSQLLITYLRTIGYGNITRVINKMLQ